MEKPEKVYSEHIAAVALGLSPSSLAARRRRHDLSCTRVDGKVGYKAGQIAVSYRITRDGLKGIQFGAAGQFHNGADVARYYLDLAEEVVLARGESPAKGGKVGNPMEKPEKVRENRLRRMAKRQGLRLVKNGRRDPRATDYGTWRIVNIDKNRIEVESCYIDDVEAYLTPEVN